jgi:erythromycin esterase-like protein
MTGPRSTASFYSLYDSIRAVLKYLDEVDPATARAARERYGCLTPWQSDPATYGHAALTGAYPTCESEVAGLLTELLHKRRSYASTTASDSWMPCKMHV